MDRTIDFWITEEQAEAICEYFGTRREDVSDNEISEFLDEIIDELN